MEDVPVFRGLKRRKLLRTQQETSLEGPLQTTSPGTEVAARRDEQDDANPNPHHYEDDVEVSTLVRARRHVRRPVTGVQFSTAQIAREDHQDGLQSTETSNQEEGTPIDISNRFVGGTGQVVNVDKHMFVASPDTFHDQNTVG